MFVSARLDLRLYHNRICSLIFYDQIYIHAYTSTLYLCNPYTSMYGTILYKYDHYLKILYRLNYALHTIICKIAYYSKHDPMIDTCLLHLEKRQSLVLGVREKQGKGSYSIATYIFFPLVHHDYSSHRTIFSHMYTTYVLLPIITNDSDTFVERIQIFL